MRQIHLGHYHHLRYPRNLDTYYVEAEIPIRGLPWGKESDRNLKQNSKRRKSTVNKGMILRMYQLPCQCHAQCIELDSVIMGSRDLWALISLTATALIATDQWGCTVQVQTATEHIIIYNDPILARKQPWQQNRCLVGSLP